MPTSYNYTGQRLDSQTGLIYYNFRYYDPLTGRFVRADTVQDNASGMDPYAYVGDNPETHNDPTGHCWPLCTALLGAAIGAVAGGYIAYAAQARSGKPINWGAVAGAAAAGAFLGGAIGAVGPVAIAGAVGFSGGTAFLAAASAVTATDAIGVGLTVGGTAAGVVGSAAAACGLSFRADTLVVTPKGNRAISRLKTGDQVKAYNPVTKTVSMQNVQHVFINHDNDLINVTLAVHSSGNQTKQRQVRVVSHGSHAPPVTIEVVHTTQKHPWLTTRGWITAGQLHLGDQVQRLDGTTATVVALSLIPGKADMYDLTVSNVHTFAVGVGQFVVHNCPVTGGGGGRWFPPTRASGLIRVDSGTNVPQSVQNVVLRTSMAQNFEGGRSNRVCCGTFIITDSEGNVVFDPALVYKSGKGGGGGPGGTHSESLEANDAAAWLSENAQEGEHYTVNFINQYQPCDKGGCMAAINDGSWNAKLNAAAVENGASAESAFYVQGRSGAISVYTTPNASADPTDIQTDPVTGIVEDITSGGDFLP
jgi:RHS repeat-associated protein